MNNEPKTEDMHLPDETALALKFQGDLDNICDTLIGAYSLKFKREVDHLSSPLLRWLDFRHRYVDPQPRQVVFSDKFPKADLPPDAVGGLDLLVRLIIEGKDINPYQGRGLILRNDISGNKRESRTDLLWADCAILHFHLNTAPIPDNQFFSKPADYLAFCIVGGDLVAFIDILRHPGKDGFAEPDLLETVYRNWPAYLEQFRLNGIHTNSTKSSSDIQKLRVGGLNYHHHFDNKAYMNPGLGVTSASTPLKVTLTYDQVRKYISDIAQMVCDAENQFQREISKLGISDPEYSIALTPKGLAVYEEISKYAFLLPRSDQVKESTFLDALHSLIAPEWALNRLTDSEQDSSAFLRI